MRDYWSASVGTVFNNGDVYNEYSPTGSFVYKLKTPNRIIGSVSFVVAKKGLISADIERVGYNTANLLSHPYSGDSYSFSNENNVIQTNYRSATNLRVGAEYRLKDMFMLRGGFGYYQNPYDIAAVENQKPKITYSGGFGYRNKALYVDLGYTLTKWSEDYYMYNPELVPNTPIEKSVGQLYITIGTKF
jgi:long-subunit fatty acid transport protein